MPKWYRAEQYSLVLFQFLFWSQVSQDYWSCCYYSVYLSWSFPEETCFTVKADRWLSYPKELRKKSACNGKMIGGVVNSQVLNISWWEVPLASCPYYDFEVQRGDMNRFIHPSWCFQPTMCNKHPHTESSPSRKE